MWQDDCEYHPSCKIQQIFVGEGINKGKKLCVLCSATYQSIQLLPSIIPIPQFYQNLERKKQQLLSTLDFQKFQNIKSNYKKYLGAVEKKFIHLLLQLSNQIMELFEGIKRQDSQYYEILNRNFDGFSNQEFPTLVEIVNENKIEHWNNLKEQSLQEIDDEMTTIFENIKDTIENLSKRIQPNFKKISDICLKLGIINMKDDDRWVKKTLLKNIWGRLNERLLQIIQLKQWKILTSVGWRNYRDVIKQAQGDLQKQSILNQDQLKYLRWEGEKQEGNRRFGRWNAFWKENQLDIGGTYDERGVKVGKWIEPFENYWDRAQIIYEGIYLNGRKKDRWNTLYKNKIIGGGFYDDQGSKQGLWKDLPLYFSDDSELIYVGKYENNKKVGIWNLENIDQFNIHKIKFEQYFNNKGHIDSHLTNEINKKFSYNCLVYHQIIYLDDEKWGEEKIYFRENINDYNFEKIGGGNYIHGLKNGYWVEISKNFSNLLIIKLKATLKSYVKDSINKGKNRINGFQSLGIMLTQALNRCYKMRQQNSGEGIYIDGIKTGLWSEIHPYYNKICQISYHGQYEKGYKVNEWDIKYKNERIGGGLYDQNGLKSLKWITIHEKFYEFCQVIYEGEYVLGKKIGQWNTLFRESSQKDFIIIGGGKYSNFGLKEGKWVDLDEMFYKQCLINERSERRQIYECEYQNGKRQSCLEITFNY